MAPIPDGVDDGAVEDASLWVNTDSFRDDMDYELSEIRMNVGNVETPPGYLDSIISKVKGGKFIFERRSFTLLRWKAQI